MILTFIKILSHLIFSSLIFFNPQDLFQKPLLIIFFLNTIEYVSYSGNITIQLADHLFQFVLLEGFFHYAQTKNHNIKERNFKHFNEREFLEAIHNINIDDVLCLDYKDPNISIENFYNNINYILDEFAPFKKLNKNDIKLKGKPWINKEVQNLMWKRDKLFKKNRNASDGNVKIKLYNDYKKLRNELTTLKRNNKLDYYKQYFEKNKKKTSALWKGIRSSVTIKSSNKTDISILDSNGELITDPLNIVNCFNEYFVNVGSTVENKIPHSNISHSHYVKQVCINKSFYLRPATADEIHDIIKPWT